MRSLRVLPLFSLLALTASCTGNSIVHDAATDAPPADATPDGFACTEQSTIHSLYPGPVYITVGGQQHVMLRLRRDSGCGMDFALRVDDAGIAQTPAMTHIDAQHGSVDFVVNGLAPGHTQLHAQFTGATGNGTSAVVDVYVMPAPVPSCPTATAAASGTLGAGGSVHGTAGTPLEFASVSVPATATTTTATTVGIGCAADQVPAGYDAIGPAIAFSPGVYRYPREIPFTVPINPALVPTYYESQVEISYSGPLGHTPRIVALSNLRFTPDGKALYFEAPRMGTYQAVIRHGLGTRHVTRHFTYRALLGISMGAIGTSMIGTRHPDLFDYLLPLGAAADWGWFGDYFQRWHLGGFCTAAERAAGMDCSMATNARSPEPNDYYTVDQNFEYWNYPDGRDGQGGTFDRQSYSQIYRDLTHMFGNPLMQSDPANGVLPLGVPATELMRTDAERCAHPVVIPSGYYDDEYNPDGTLPVITFCDGLHAPGHAGEFIPGQGDYPFEPGLAVDINNNGIRDPGEPVIRNLAEPWQDTGTDGIASRDETGYDVATNPDPAGDDYDRVYNPAGTEANFLHETGEPFQDVGLDGIACPSGRTCQYDVGEGNSRWDMAAGINGFLTHNGRSLYAALPHDQAHRVGMWLDGGTRDLFNFGASASNFVSGVSQQGESLGVFNNFGPLSRGPMFDPNSDSGFVFTDVDWAHLPDHVLLRYGFPDASAALLQNGDGGHVGTVEQITNRLYAAVWWAQSRWPDTSRYIARFSSVADDANRCANGYFCNFTFHSDRANRDGPVSIYLPPGYHDTAHSTETYPVVFFLHGYGMQPSDLSASGLLIGNYMSSGNIAEWQRPAKVIMVFPDGRCREGDGCPRGTFYVDSPNPGNAHMESFFLDLYDYVSAHYRARPPGDVEVVE